MCVRRIGLAVALVALSSEAQAQNRPPPVPPLKYPDGTEPVRTRQPTIILDNVDDPDGDEIEYFIEVDSNPCFCSTGVQSSGPLSEGGLVTQWQVPRELAIPEGQTDPESCSYFIRRWTS